MQTRYLLPNYLKKIGWILFVPSLLVGSYLWLSGHEFDNALVTNVFAIWTDDIFVKDYFFSFIENGVLDEILTTCIITGGLFVGFSKEKDEDEFIAQLRTESLIWATYVNAIIFLLATLFVYGIPYFTIMVFNSFTMIIFFVIRFQFLIYKSKRALSHEE